MLSSERSSSPVAPAATGPILVLGCSLAAPVEQDGKRFPGQGICRNIQHPWHMLCRKMEFIISRREKQGTEQMVHQLILCGLIEQHRNNSHVVRVKTDMTSLPHTAAAMTTGTSSFWAIATSDQLAGH